MENIVVIIDDNGSALGAVCMRKENAVLVDKVGKIIQNVSLKITVKEAKDILLRRKINYVI
jgi:hypothetical protein